MVILALSATVVFAMVSLSDISISRSQLYSEASQARELISAAEASATIALRRDLIDAPETDHYGEIWKEIQQDQVVIENGRFTLSITDAQSRLNLNAISGAAAASLQLLRKVLSAVEIPPETATQIAARLVQKPPITSLNDLRSTTNLNDTEIARLAELVTVLPARTDININTAPDGLIGALADNPVQARNLIGIRNRQGFLTPQDVLRAGMIMPPGVGFKSRYFFVVTDVTIGQTRQSQTSLLQRVITQTNQADVSVIARYSGYQP